MKAIGMIMLFVGFLAGAYATALDVERVQWVLFGIAVVVAVFGMQLVKRADSAHAQSDAVLENNRNALRQSLDNVVRDLEEMTTAPKPQGEALRERIDNHLREDLRRFAEARDSMVHLFGLQTYADIMSSFAAGERYINRVWSASVDGYDAEAEVYVEKAASQFADAQSQLTRAAEAPADA
jgi:ElaB/YqjD/DUF883 family membrane-anchored ribosome-binding protein